jgi:hypothetical protein
MAHGDPGLNENTLFQSSVDTIFLAQVAARSFLQSP